ncbi:MAG: APC family permease [Mycolicibacterium sp.]
MFMVLAAVTPIGAVIGVVPIAIGIGNGSGVVGTYVFVGAVLLLFAIGYAAMSHHITNAGAFYSYVSHGLGRLPGLAAAGVGLLAYNCITVAVAVALGFFTRKVVRDNFGIELPWLVWTAFFLIVVAALGRRGVDVSAKFLGAAVVLEVVVLSALNIAILVDRGWSAFSLEPFTIAAVFTGASGVSFMYAFYTFIGFEASAIFAEEARDAHKTVPRATLIAVVSIAVFYIFTSWSLISAYEPDEVQAIAAEHPDAFVLDIATKYLGSIANGTMQLLLVISIFAATLGLHNATARYFYALGRDRVLPENLARVHPKFKSPYYASATQIAISAVVIIVGAVGGGDPLLQLSTSFAGLGTLGIVFLQAATAVSVVAFFRRRADRRWFTTLIAPTLGAVGLLAAAGLIVWNYKSLTGTTSSTVNLLPIALPVVALAAMLWGLRLKRIHPDRYASVGGTDLGASEDRQPSYSD